MLPLHKNALIRRGAWLTFRTGRLAASAIVLGAILGVALLFIVMAQRADLAVIDWPKVWQAFGFVVAVIQVIAATYAALGMSLGAIGEEKQRKTYEFLVTLPLSPANKTVGMALGSTMSAGAVLAALTPLGFLSSWAGGADVGRLLWFYAVLYGGYLAVSLLGVALSHGVGGGGLGWLLVFIVAGAGIVLGGALHDNNAKVTPLLTLTPFNLMEFSLRSSQDAMMVRLPGPSHFYNWAVPWQSVPLAFEVYLAALSFILARRKLSRPSAPPLPRTTVLWAMVVFQFLLIGFLADYLAEPGDLRAFIVGLQVAYFLLVLLWGVMSQPDYAQLMQWCGKTPRGVFPKLLADIRSAQSPNLLSMAALWAICIAGLLSMLNLYGHSMPVLPGIICSAVLLTYLLTYQLLVVLMAFSVRRGEKILGFLLMAACVVVPSLFSTIPGLSLLGHATPGDLLFSAWEVGESRRVFLMLSPDWLLDAAKSFGFAGAGILVFGYLCWWRLGIMRRRLPADLPPLPAAA
jgi:hypothetical protein